MLRRAISPVSFYDCSFRADSYECHEIYDTQWLRSKPEPGQALPLTAEADFPSIEKLKQFMRVVNWKAY